MATSDQAVALTTGYTVEINGEDWLDHLFQAIIGESMTKVRDDSPENADGLEVIGTVYDLCQLELFYVAGQLLMTHSSIDLAGLLHEFPAHWDRFAEQVNKDR